MPTNVRSVRILLLLVAAVLPLGCVREKKVDSTGEVVAAETGAITAEESQDAAPEKEAAAQESPAKTPPPVPESAAVESAEVESAEVESAEVESDRLVIKVRANKDRESNPEVTFKGVVHDEASLAKALAGEVALQRTRDGNGQASKEATSEGILSPIEAEIQVGRDAPKASLIRVFATLHEVGIYQIAIVQPSE